MKTTTRLNIEDKPGYFLMNMTNINDLDPKLLLINEIKIFGDESTMFKINYCEKNNTPHVVFNDIECAFKNSGVFSYLIYCETEKNKKMLDKFVKIFDKIKEKICFILNDNIFVMGKGFMKFRLKTKD